MSEEIKNPETNEAEKPQETDFTNFLTAEDEFRMEMEKYIPVFVERLTSNTLESDQDFINWTLELMDLGKAAGIDMQKYIMDYCHENGLAQ
ncbi:hypothetical protein SAMN02910353_00781 [Ruminococcus sp. YRD2003]|uniref:hypothetical protein n=1 Tax=Ruminococcus sp. YRD2003 TaxID=1452313 RepID=UPI0008D75900|nr:hypothetical protein SAMN02910353_00781 [Ruminococcus flavefaciens]